MKAFKRQNITLSFFMLQILFIAKSQIQNPYISSIINASFNEFFEEIHPPTCAVFPRLRSSKLLFADLTQLCHTENCSLRPIHRHHSLKNTSGRQQYMSFMFLDRQQPFLEHLLRILLSLNIVSPQFQGS